jgi:hypothetical protein
MHYFLPVGVVSEIMGHLPRKDLQRAMLVNKMWHQAFLGCRSFWDAPSLFGTSPEILEDVVGVMSETIPGEWLTLESPEPGTAPRIVEACGHKYGSLTCFSLYDHREIVEALGCCRHLVRLGVWLRPETNISSLVHMSCLEELDIMFLGSGAVVSMYDLPSGGALRYLHMMGVEQVISWKRSESLRHLTLETKSQLIDLNNFPNLETLDVMARHLYLYGCQDPSSKLTVLSLDTRFLHFEDEDDTIDWQFPSLKHYKAKGWHFPPSLPPLLESVDIDARNYYLEGIIDWSSSNHLTSVILDRVMCDTLKLPTSVHRLVLSDVSGEIVHT